MDEAPLYGFLLVVSCTYDHNVTNVANPQAWTTSHVQGYLNHKQQRPVRTLLQEYA